MKHPIVLTVSTGRCGTVFLRNVFHEHFSDRGVILHESVHANKARPAHFHRAYDPATQDEMRKVPDINAAIDEWKRASLQGPVVEFGWTTSALVPLLWSEIGDQLRVVVLYRHPVEAAASHTIKGHYTINRSPAWAISPFHERVRFPEFRERWPSMSPFERSLYRWLETTAYGLELKEKLPELSVYISSCEHLFGNSPQVVSELAEFCGLGGANIDVSSIRRNESMIQHLEVRPLADDGRSACRHPEITAFAEQLGYSMSLAEVERIMRKYQLPAGLLPRLRHYLGYWGMRFYGGAVLRKIGLRKSD